eukprot:1158126-Pelagomonas_calceolata.AAC.9
MCMRTHLLILKGVNPQRYLDGFTWDEFKWRRGELQAQFQGMTVMAGVDDMDSFKGIDLKLQVDMGMHVKAGLVKLPLQFLCVDGVVLSGNSLDPGNRAVWRTFFEEAHLF